MKNIIYITIVFLIIADIYSQEADYYHYYHADSINPDDRNTYLSYEGWYYQSAAFQASIKPYGTYRLLNILVNIIYDVDTINPYPNNNGIWDQATEQGINNQNIPFSLISDFLDLEFNYESIRGAMSRLYHEASFGKLVLIGDYMIVNISQTYLNNGGPSNELNAAKLRSRVFDFINENGGLDNALFGRTSLLDYDYDNNGSIDMIQFIVRNSRNDTIAQYGSHGYGQGEIFGKILVKLMINGIIKNQYPVLSHQAVGNDRYLINPTGIVIHEFLHALFGGNSFHTSGGNHYTGGGTNTWFGVEGGYGLMGGGKSGLVSCNGYERLRMNWSSPVYNPEKQVIQASRVNSDISKGSGNKTFILRDFVTTGDAIRIRLPYKDEGASNQYIWLENHQMLSGNIDLNQTTTKGIYAYIQVGKDDKYNAYSIGELSPGNYTNPLCGFGNYDFDFEVGAKNRLIINTELSNPFTGYHFLRDKLIILIIPQIILF